MYYSLRAKVQICMIGICFGLLVVQRTSFGCWLMVAGYPTDFLRLLVVGCAGCWLLVAGSQFAFYPLTVSRFRRIINSYFSPCYPSFPKGDAPRAY